MKKIFAVIMASFMMSSVQVNALSLTQATTLGNYTEEEVMGAMLIDSTAVLIAVFGGNVAAFYGVSAATQLSGTISNIVRNLKQDALNYAETGHMSPLLAAVISASQEKDSLLSEEAVLERIEFAALQLGIN